MIQKIIHRFSLLVVIIAISCGSTTTGNGTLKYYNLSKPDHATYLPVNLHEVSGITQLDSVTLACIQDEQGIIFIYDLKKDELTGQHRFNVDGDYEGITRAGKILYVLRSDGTLFEIENFTSDKVTLKSYKTGIPANNNEGLCYHIDRKSLFIAVKGKTGKGPGFKDLRVIYEFDLHTKKLSQDPIFAFDLNAIKKFALDKNLDIETKQTGKKPPEPMIRFMTSAIGIHPISKNLYLLSAVDHMLFIFDQNGTIEHIEVLDPVMFNKAEGITFFDNGDMLITNEGQKSSPSLLRFNYSQ